MEEANEGLDVRIKEIKDDIKEISFGLNTADSGIATEITDIITGNIKCIIIKADAQASIDISLLEYDIPIFTEVAFNGVEYLPLRVFTINSEHKQGSFSPVEWTINDKLKFEIKGAKFTNVEFIVRWV